MLAAAPASLNIDSGSLDALRREAANNPKAAARQAAVQFEALFMQQVMKSMRDATMKAEESGPGTEQFTSMLDTQFAKQFAGQRGGLADMLEKQLTRHMQNLPAISPENIPKPAPPVAAIVPSTASFASTTAAVGTAATGALSALRSAGSRAADFVRRMLPHAQEAERQTGVPASFILPM